MASIPICGICGGRGWGHICAGNEPAWVKTILNDQRAAKRVEAVGDARMKVMDQTPAPLFSNKNNAVLAKTAIKPAAPLKTSGFAPIGQCAHCDAMRAGAAERQRRITEKRKAKGGNR